MKSKRKKELRLQLSGTNDGVVPKIYWFVWLYRLFFEPERWLRRNGYEGNDRRADKRSGRHEVL